MKVVIQVRRPNVVGTVRILSASLVDEVPDDPIAREVIQPVREILPKEKFCERELPEPHIRFHLPTRQVAHCVAKELKDTANIDAGLVLRQGIEARDLFLKML